MCKRFVSIWFRYLSTDWFTIRRPEFREQPFVLSAPSHGRMVISAANALAEMQGVHPGMVVADARAVVPSLQVLDDKPGLAQQLLSRIAIWCIRFSPVVAVDHPDGLILDVTGCAHLWGGESDYLTAICKRFRSLGYHVRAGIADTIGAAWAVTRFGQQSLLVKPGKQLEALMPLPPEALRLDSETTHLLQKLGFLSIGQLINISRSSLNRRFGEGLAKQIGQALGSIVEYIEPVIPVQPWQERLPCLEPILTRAGIDIALEKLLDAVCTKLQQEEKGLRKATFSVFRIDGKKQQIEISTHRPSHNTVHLFKLFENKLSETEPGPGIELFLLEAFQVEEHKPLQKKIWEGIQGIEEEGLSELVDRIAGKFGENAIQRFLPDEHHWPERSVKQATSLSETPGTSWKVDRPRPVQLLSSPQVIEVTAPIPDYPPLLFRYHGKLHTIKKSDGPERIEQEWWIARGEHRDYYAVEDQDGNRYWIFREGHYTHEKKPRWFIHGFFA